VDHLRPPLRNLVATPRARLIGIAIPDGPRSERTRVLMPINSPGRIDQWPPELPGLDRASGLDQVETLSANQAVEWRLQAC